MEDNKIIKKRNIPHIDGNFNVYFYIKIKQSKKINNLTDDIINILGNNSICPYEKLIINNDEYYHISLTKTFFIKYHEINNYINQIIQNIILLNNNKKEDLMRLFKLE